MPGEQSTGRDDAVLPQMPGQQWCQAVITARSAQCGFSQVACRRKTANLWRSTDSASTAISLCASNAGHAEQPNHEQVDEAYEHER